MEQNPPYTAPLNHPTPLVSSSFSSISELIKKSWLRTQNQLLRLFLLTLIPVVGVVVTATIFILALIGMSTLSIDTSGIGIGMGIMAVILVPLLTVLMTALGAATIMLIADTDPNISSFGIFKKSLKKVWPLFLVTIISWLIVAGGFVILIIPGILFSVLLSFASYLVILENVSPLQAVRKSVYIISKNFGIIFVRLIVLFLIGFMGGLIINLITGSDGSLVANTVSFVFNLLFSWFSVAYTYSLFQEAKKMAGEGSGKLIWMAVVALIGWLLITGIVYLVIRSGVVNQSNTISTPSQIDNSFLEIDEDEDLFLTPSDSVLPASDSSSPRASTTPRPSASPKASTATSSANR